MDELMAFVHARLDEDERLAVSGESWTAFDEAQGTRRVDVDNSSERVVACTRSWRGLHIARHDPARVLCDVQSRRATLVRCQEEMLSGIPRLVHFAKMTVWEMAQRWNDHETFKERWKP